LAYIPDVKPPDDKIIPIEPPEAKAHGNRIQLAEDIKKMIPTLL
jgi:hypothetical protein